MSLTTLTPLNYILRRSVAGNSYIKGKFRKKRKHLLKQEIFPILWNIANNKWDPEPKTRNSYDRESFVHSGTVRTIGINYPFTGIGIVILKRKSSYKNEHLY